MMHSACLHSDSRFLQGAASKMSKLGMPADLQRGTVAAAETRKANKNRSGGSKRRRRSCSV